MKPSQLIPEHIGFALRFFFPPLITFILGNVLFECLAFNLLKLNQTLIFQLPDVNSMSSEIKLYEIKARLLWATSVMLYFFIIIRFAVFIWSTFNTCATKLTILFFTLLASSLFLIEAYYLTHISPSKSPIASIFHLTFTTLSTSGLFTSVQLSTLENTLNILNLTALLTVPFGITAGCCIMHHIPFTQRKEPEYFLNRSTQLKELMTLSSAVMVIGIIHMQLWLSWPLSLVPQSKEITQLSAIILVICQYWGVFYSLVIASLYYPSANYLSQQAKIALLQSDNQTLRENPSTWLTENNMQLSLTSSSFSQIIIVIAPMLAGSLGSTFSQLIPF
jgi:hypothetical protein